MKSMILIILMTFVLSSTTSAMNCQIIEYPDHNEAICGDNSSRVEFEKTRSASVKGSGESTRLREKYRDLKDEISKLQRNLHRYREYFDSNKYFSPSQVSGITVSANHIDIERNKYVEVTISCDVTSVGSGDVDIIIEGLSFKGEVLSSIPLHGYVEAGSYARLSSGKPKHIPIKKFQNIRSWEPRVATITTRLSNDNKDKEFNESKAQLQLDSLFIEAEALQRQIGDYRPGAETVAYEPAPREIKSQTSNGGVSGDVIELPASMGKVTFSHSGHQARYDCTKCHSNSSGGRIIGFGKDWAHKTCKGCHTEIKQGPTSCKECHKK